MKQLVVISGKGGTGKTVLTSSFASLAWNHVTADCDVDAADLHLMLRPEILESHPFIGGKKAKLDSDQCTGCGECIRACYFQAIRESDAGDILIDPISCEGCGICPHVCPVDALSMEDSISGEWFISRTRYGPLVHARLGIAEENSGKLVTQVRKMAQEIAEKDGRDLVIIDGPPGIGCPVIASLSGTDLALVVTEPTLSGIHDMERVIGVAGHFKTRAACCINKFDLSLRNSEMIEDWCRDHNVPILGKIPYDDDAVQSVVQGVPLPEFSRRSAAGEVIGVWERLLGLLENGELRA